MNTPLFVSKNSCFTNLLETFEDWTLAIDTGFGIDVIYLDHSKAFDSEGSATTLKSRIPSMKSVKIHINI